MPDTGSRPDPATPPGSLLPAMLGYMGSQTLYVAARLGIADLLREQQPRQSDDLARATGAEPRSLYRLLRALVVLGVLEESEPSRFKLTPLGGSLCKDVPGSVRNIALLFCGDGMWKSWANLLHSTRTGETAFRRLFGMGTFEYRQRHPEDAAVFNEAMGELTRQVASALVGMYDFSRFRTLVDVGGGNGTLLAAILAATPALQGIVFDLPDGLADARAQFEAAGVADRARTVAGDFFKTVPSGGDAYIMKSVIHDWDDDRTVEIFAKCRRAMPSNGTLLVVEPVVPERLDGSPAHLRIVMLDLHMLVATGGQERTEREFKGLLTKAGFRMTRVIPPPPPSVFSLVEATPA